MENINLKNKIIYSDHGAQYSLKEFSIFIKRVGTKISMSKIGNSLDNGEAKYFFSNIKSECLSHINTNMVTVDEIDVNVGKYIKWYNYNWIQNKCKWKILHQQEFKCVHFKFSCLVSWKSEEYKQ